MWARTISMIYGTVLYLTVSCWLHTDDDTATPLLHTLYMAVNHDARETLRCSGPMLTGPLWMFIEYPEFVPWSLKPLRYHHPYTFPVFFLQSMINCRMPFVSFYKNMVSAREWKMWRCDLLRVPLLACWAFQETPAVSFVDVNVTFLRSLSPFDALHFSLRRPRCPFPTRRRSATCTPHAGCTSRWCARVWHQSHVMTGRDQTSGFKSRQGADGGWWRQRPCFVFSLSHIPFWSF